ncbi:cysteinyl-tRNA synthetase, putative [Ricinus communis]|uniref:Cysteinyl-tRNA synthetase, putative n=1 Tax=Ricinus communis TaxID=3988 RepID=B9SLX9_RICCO|nr:cysteinyl-tRNA synthetase, putative [Ricinus communis]
MFNCAALTCQVLLKCSREVNPLPVKELQLSSDYQQWFAYASEGDVFFSVDEFPNYGQLSGQKLENHRAGERNPDSRKQNPADFALWKAAKPGEPSWESPWVPGRPGWHIECGAMSVQCLTFKFDIHGGGSDLIFPHYENEMTRSIATCQESNVSYWMHNGHVTNNNEKMSKSPGMLSPQVHAL